MSKKKILTDNGELLGYFDDQQELKNKDLMLYGFQSANIRPKEQPVSRENIIRKPFKPTVTENKYGLMCPTCNQSRYIEVIDKVNGNSAVIQSLEGNEYYIPSNKSFKEFIKILDKEENLFTFFKKSIDELSEQYGLEFKTIKSLKDLSAELINTNPLLYCPQCNGENLAQDFVNEYVRPSSKFHLICQICGGEMQIQNNDLGKQICKCSHDSCGFEGKFDIRGV